jgi:hypothetical protein
MPEWQDLANGLYTKSAGMLLIRNYQHWCYVCKRRDMASDALVEFKDWLVAAKPGERYVYASGIAVMGDIARSTEEGRAWMDKVRPVRRAALAAYEAGDVILLQKRNGKGFDYIAQRRNTSKKR